MKKIIIFSTLAMMSFNIYAMFCPTNFSQINIGDTKEQVIQQCGKPDKITEKKMTQDNQPQEWNYYVKPDPTQPTTLKMTIAFDGNMKAVNISVNGTSLISTTICNNNNIQLGDTAESIKSMCGDPAFKNQSPQDDATTTVITEYSYNSTPPMTLLFKEGKLTDTQ